MEHCASKGDDSTSESHFVGYSETGSLVESVGSAEIESSPMKARPNRKASTDRRMSGSQKKFGTQYMDFVRELHDVPVTAVWAIIRDHEALAAIVPGIVESFHHLEGQGGAGTVYIAKYASTWLKPGGDKYLINKVEVNDDDSKLYAVRRLGGQYQIWYHVYILYIQVLAHHILGDRSSVIVWRLESQRRNVHSSYSGHCPSAEDARNSYVFVTDRIKERYFTMNRVDRPILVDGAVAVNMRKRLRLRSRTGKQPLKGPGDNQEPEDSSQQRRRKSRNDDGSDRESKTERRLRRTRGRPTSG